MKFIYIYTLYILYLCCNLLVRCIPVNWSVFFFGELIICPLSSNRIQSFLLYCRDSLSFWLYLCFFETLRFS